jgi:hypothetical protein
MYRDMKPVVDLRYTDTYMPSKSSTACAPHCRARPSGLPFSKMEGSASFLHRGQCSRCRMADDVG